MFHIKTYLTNKGSDIFLKCFEKRIIMKNHFLHYLYKHYSEKKRENVIAIKCCMLNYTPVQSIKKKHFLVRQKICK